VSYQNTYPEFRAMPINWSTCSIVQSFPKGNIIDGSETGSVSWYKFSHKQCWNGGDGSRECILTKKRCSHTYEKITKNVKCQTNENLRKRNSIMNSLIFIVQQYRWWHTSSWRWLEEIKHWSLAWQRSLLLLQNLIIASYHPFLWLLFDRALSIR